MLRVVFELPLVVHPFAAQLRKVFVVELFLECRGLHVIHASLAVELVVLPMALICYRAVLVVEFAEPMHFIVFPLPLEMSSVFEIENAVSVLFSVGFVALVAASFWNLLLHILQF